MATIVAVLGDCWTQNGLAVVQWHLREQGKWLSPTNLHEFRDYVQQVIDATQGIHGYSERKLTETGQRVNKVHLTGKH